MAEPMKTIAPISPEEMRAAAHRLGLERLSDEHLAQLGRATAALQGHINRLPRDLPAAVEPAAVFRPVEPKA